MDQDDTVKSTELPTGQDLQLCVRTTQFGHRSTDGAGVPIFFFFPRCFRVSPEFEISPGNFNIFSSSCFAQWGTYAFESFKLITKREEKQRRGNGSAMQMKCRFWMAASFICSFVGLSMRKISGSGLRSAESRQEKRIG
jgi:hypothetical protein